LSAKAAIDIGLDTPVSRSYTMLLDLCRRSAVAPFLRRVQPAMIQHKYSPAQHSHLKLSFRLEPRLASTAVFIQLIN
jgi:hypothetical protein